MRDPVRYAPPFLGAVEFAMAHGTTHTHSHTHQEAALARALENVLLNQAKILGFEMLPCRKI